SWKSSQHGFKGDLPFDAGQCCPETKMRCPAKGKMTIILSRQVKAVWIGEARRVAISSGHHRNNGLFLANEFPAEFDIFRSKASGVLTRTLITKKLFHC